MIAVVISILLLGSSLDGERGFSSRYVDALIIVASSDVYVLRLRIIDRESIDCCLNSEIAAFSGFLIDYECAIGMIS